MNNVLTKKVKELSIVLNDKQIQQFEQYYNILVEWNKVMNLTAVSYTHLDVYKRQILRLHSYLLI